MARPSRLGVGFVGSGFITRFHIQSWLGVRDADVRGVWSPHRERAEEAAALSGRPYLARAAEEHSGPHMPWFWRGDLQGGGVLNDMMCHSVEVGRNLLTRPGAPRSSIKPTKVSAQIASLKWSRPEYAELLKK